MNKAMQEQENNQYGRTFGHPDFVTKIAEVYGKKLGKNLDPLTNVLVTHGANGALNAFINAFCNKGDSAVTFGPMFPVYIEHTEIAGGTIESVPLEYSGNKFTFDP